MKDHPTPPKEWIPYLLVEGKPRTRLFLGRRFFNRDQIGNFFAFMHRTHPRLDGQHIEFEEQVDSPARVVVPGRRDT